jgi:hypothetical protein
MPRVPTILTFCLAGAIALETSAAVLVDKPLDVSTIEAGYQSNSGDLQLAEDFVLGGPAQATLIKFSGWYFNSTKTTGSFDILFFNDIGGLPDTSHFYLHNTGGITGIFQAVDTDALPPNVYEWSAVIPAVSFLSAGTYWVSIRDTDASSVQWIWEHSATNGDSTVVDRSTNGAPWQAIAVGGGRDTQAVRIEGEFITAAVPEPTSVVAFAALGGCLVAGSRRRRVTNIRLHRA